MHIHSDSHSTNFMFWNIKAIAINSSFNLSTTDAALFKLQNLCFSRFFKCSSISNICISLHCFRKSSFYVVEILEQNDLKIIFITNKLTLSKLKDPIEIYLIPGISIAFYVSMDLSIFESSTVVFNVELKKHKTNHW